jgi:hypothetical protein
MLLQIAAVVSAEPAQQAETTVQEVRRKTAELLPAVLHVYVTSDNFFFSHFNKKRRMLCPSFSFYLAVTFL